MLPGRDLDKQDNCIATPAEYVAAFAARAPRCVSDNLVGHVSKGKSVANAAFTDATTRMSYFWSGADVLAKYMRIGYPKVREAGPAWVLPQSICHA